MEWRQQSLAGPTLLNDSDQLLRYVETSLISPAGFKPSDEFVARILVEHIDVQFPLAAETGHGEIATTEKCEDRIKSVVAVCEIELRVKSVSKVKLNGELSVS